jgi:hypothetical protein
MVKLPVPDPETEMGGTSSVPPSVRLTVELPDDVMLAHAAIASDATIARICFMKFPPV